MKAMMKFRDVVHRCAKAVHWLPSTLARLILGAVFLEAGYGKLTNLDKVVGFFTQLGIPAPYLQAPFVAVTEFFCGGLILLGCFTRVASVPLSFTMVVAILTAKRAELNGVTDLFGMADFLYIGLFTWLFVHGGGPFSLDRLLLKKFGGHGSANGPRLARAA